MILSGPKACRGSTKEAKIFPAFLHSPAPDQYSCITSTALRDDLLLIEEGIGLLIPKGMLTVSRASLEISRLFRLCLFGALRYLNRLHDSRTTAEARLGSECS